MAIFLITAPSGAGKTSIAQSIQNKGYWSECISCTTRTIRKGEVDGKTYYFKTIEEFESMILNKELVERVQYNGNLYGISRDEIERVMEKGKHVFIIAEHDGYKQIKKQYPDAIGIFLYATKEDCMINMLSRGDSFGNALSRINLYDDEMKNRNDYDYVIKNVRNHRWDTENLFINIIKQHDEPVYANTTPLFIDTTPLDVNRTMIKTPDVVSQTWG